MKFNCSKMDIILAIGICMVVGGVIFSISFPYIFSYLLRKELALVNGTLGFKKWKDIPLPIYQNIYFFNITNSEDFVRGKAEARLQEVGPYTYKSKWTKKDIEWNSNGTVSFKEIRLYEFVPDKSVGKESDEVVTLNAPYMMVAGFLKRYAGPNVAAALLEKTFKGEKLFVRRSIKQLTFDGFYSCFISLAHIFKIPTPFKDDSFSWLNAQNATDDGTYTVFTGEDDLDNLNVIERWNGERSLKFWNGTSCAMIKNSNAEISPPLTSYQKSFSFFQSIFCRSLTLEYSEDVQHRGIGAKRFIATEATLGNRADDPDSACFITERKLLSGLQDISRCQYDSPVAISFPHFYLADPSYRKNFTDLHPTSDLHRFQIDVEPYTGFSVGAAIRFQVNIYFERIPGVSQLAHISDSVFPVFWAEIEFSLDEEMANLFRVRVTNPRLAVHVFIWSFIVIGGFMITVVGVVKFSLWMKRRKVQPLP